MSFLRPVKQTPRKSASVKQPSIGSTFEVFALNSISGVEERPRKRAKNDDSECEDSGDDVEDPPPKKRGRPPKSKGPVSDILSMQRKSAKLLKALDADLQQLQQRNTQIDELKAENARLEQNWNESKRMVGELKKSNENLTKKLEECGETEIGLKSEVAQVKELLFEAEHTKGCLGRDVVKWKDSSDGLAEEKRRLEERVKALEGMMMQSKGEFTKFIDGLKSGLPGLERLLGGITDGNSA
ncbi:hypothetical protein VNI00_016277 [Paramarasmius palmivorus]|uniref:Uncharacterized protein n=1 Tax=Paramarasmius palmivorus TaxID=297713 RepID=A0AAW0BFA3_9AGAR